MLVTNRSFVCVICGLALSVTGCFRPIGPQSVARDRQLYASSLSDSWKEQTLLNIVKMRYLDPPIFVDVGNIVASYSLKAGLDRERLLEVLSKTAVIAPAHVGKLARAATNDYSPQFPLRLMNKDFQLILKAAAQEHISMPVTEAAFRVNSDELAHSAEEDFSAVVRRMEEVAGIAAIHSSQ